MSEGSPFAVGPPAPRFQFGLAAAFHLITGTAVALSLITWEPALGSVAAILGVGSWWAVLAHRAGRRALAYHLAAVVLGEIGGLVFLLPLVLLARGEVGWEATGPAAAFCAVMAAATALTARLLRRMIRWGQGHNLLGTGITAVYVTALVFVAVAMVGYVAIAIVMTLIQGDVGWAPPAGEILFFPAIAMAWCVGSVVVATLWLPLMGPTAMLFCWILRRIDPDTL